MRVSPRRCAIVLPCVPGHGLDTLHPLVTLAVVSYTTKMGFSVLTFGYLWNFEKHACSKTILRCILPSKVARLSRYRVVGMKLDADSYRFSVGSRLLISIEALENSLWTGPSPCNRQTRSECGGCDARDTLHAPVKSFSSPGNHGYMYVQS